VNVGVLSEAMHDGNSSSKLLIRDSNVSHICVESEHFVRGVLMTVVALADDVLPFYSNSTAYKNFFVKQVFNVPP